MANQNTHKEISMHVYSGEQENAPTIPYFKIKEGSLTANLTIPGLIYMRDFEDVKPYIEDLSKAALKLMQQGYRIEFDDAYGCGKIVPRKPSSIINDGGFNLVQDYFGEVSTKSNPTLESAIVLALKTLSEEPIDFENYCVLEKARAIADAQIYETECPRN